MRGLTALFLFVASSSAIDIKLKVYPEPDDLRSSLIWFNLTSYTEWSQKLDNYLEVYRTPSLTQGRSENIVKCDYNEQKSSLSVCKINVESFNPCVATNYFGYNKAEPCVFLELKKIIEWRPLYYNSTNALPKDMPKILQEHIDQVTSDPAMWENIWVSCDGDTPADKEFIGEVNYIPHHGFPGYLFPYLGQMGYLNPIMAVHFKNPKVGIVINIECRAWGPGIAQDDKKGIGVVKFQLLIDTLDHHRNM